MVMATYLFIHASRSYFPNGVMKVSIVGPVHGGTTVPELVRNGPQSILYYKYSIPFGNPVVVFGDGAGSYCRLRSQYWV